MVFHVRICALTLLSWILFHGVEAQRNVTLDDQDPAIIYAPAANWTRSNSSALDYGGSHMLTQDSGATATLKFTGIAIYYLSPLWPYLVNTAISLDSGPITLVDLVDHSRPNAGQGPETVQSHVVWNATGLANTQHTLVISIGQGQPYGIVDGLIYTVISSPSSLSTLSSTGTTRVVASATSSSSINATRRKRKLSIALGSVFGLLALLLIFLIVWFFYLPRRKKRNSEAWTIDNPPHNGSSSATNGNRNEPGYQQSQWAAGGGYPVGQAPQPGYPMEQGTDGSWQNVRYGFVGNMHPPPITALQPSQQQPYYAHPQDPYDQNASKRAPNRYMPGYTLSTITEKSTPQMGAYSPPLPTSASIGANTPASFRTEELGGYPAAPASQGTGGGVQAAAGDARDARRPYYGAQPNNDKVEKPNIQQPPSNPPTDGKPSSYWI